MIMLFGARLRIVVIQPCTTGLSADQALVLSMGSLKGS